MLLVIVVSMAMKWLIRWPKLDHYYKPLLDAMVTLPTGKQVIAKNVS
jgi:hypothetical protein